MHRRTLGIVLAVTLTPLLTSAELRAQYPASDAQRLTEPLSGRLATDFAAAESTPSTSAAAGATTLSVPLAGLLSAVLPGAGQVYSEAPLWRAALYATIEAAGWTAFAVTSSRGGELTDDFQRYADDHWSVVRYIDWLGENYSRWSDSAVNKAVVADALLRIYRSNDPSRPEWERVDFEQLNRIERAVRGGFSHTLPRHGEQQYYEEIGKYVQYRSGWDDHDRSGDTLIYDPAHVTGRNQAYMDKRADANDFLGYASTALGAIIVNHLASMLDAVLTARAYNASVRAELKGSLLPDAGRPLEPTLHLAIRF
jgi:hypothetical protein